MKTSKKTPNLIAAAACLMVLGAASVAWACTQQAYIGSISPGSGPSGSRATVSGSRFNPGPVQIRWNSTDGAVLATGSGPDFSVAVTIPNATPDTYSVVAVQREGNVVLGKASVTFTVTPADTAMSGGYNSSEGGTATDDGQAASGSTSRSSSGSQAASGGSDTAAGSITSGNGGAAFPSESQAPGAGAPTPSAASSAQSAASGAAKAAQSGAVPIRSPLAGSTAAPGDRDQTPVPATAATVQATAASPSPRSATADLWGGFAGSEPTRSVGLDAPASGSGSTSPLALGAGLLSGGLVALLAGFGVAENRRRRVLSTSRSVAGRV